MDEDHDRPKEPAPRNEELRAAPSETLAEDVDETGWPPGIRKLALSELSALGIDVNRKLYWHGQPINAGQMLVLTAAQKAWGLVLASGALLAIVATVIQGWTAGFTWMCQVGWIHTWCPVG